MNNCIYKLTKNYAKKKILETFLGFFLFVLEHIPVGSSWGSFSLGCLLLCQNTALYPWQRLLFYRVRRMIYRDDRHDRDEARNNRPAQLRGLLHTMLL